MSPSDPKKKSMGKKMKIKFLIYLYERCLGTKMQGLW